MLNPRFRSVVLTLAGVGGLSSLAHVGFGPTTVFAVPPPCCGCGADCNHNGVDDACDISCANAGGGFCLDGFQVLAGCNTGYFLGCGVSDDCNGNGIPDDCEMLSGSTCDANLNNVPDECEYQIPVNVRLVDDDAPLGGDGLTWCTAYRSLQDALFAAVAGHTIRVAQGTYRPVDCAPTCGPADRTATFHLKNGVTIQGGYAGLGATDPNARNISGNPTILSGDLNGDDGTVGTVRKRFPRHDRRERRLNRGSRRSHDPRRPCRRDGQRQARRGDVRASEHSEDRHLQIHE